MSTVSLAKPPPSETTVTPISESRKPRFEKGARASRPHSYDAGKMPTPAYMATSENASAPKPRFFLDVHEEDGYLRIAGRHFRLLFGKHSGGIERLEMFNGLSWHSVLADGKAPGLNLTVPVVETRVTHKTNEQLRLTVTQQDDDWRVETNYEIYARGYVVATFRMSTRKDGARAQSLTVGVGIKESIFSRPHRIINEAPTPEMRQIVRGFSVNFTTDDRPVTNSLDFLLESVALNANGKPPLRYVENKGTSRELGWKLTTGWPYPFPEGYVYENRWCLSFTALDQSPSPIRGQRIYQWFGNTADNFAVPTEEELLEMAEYGCSILVFHMPVLTGIDFQEVRDPEGMLHCVQRAHSLGMKVLFYVQPYLIHRFPSIPENLRDKRTECLNVWHAMNSSQVANYDPNFTEYDCDELNLRHPEAFQYIRDAALYCYKKYHFDGLYVDFAWPAQGLAVNPENNQPGLFNFYDYLKLLREWRTALGPEGLMIGHGGGFLVGSDMVEGFDACLTGEAQRVIIPDSLGVQYGPVPTLWIIQRNKRDIFRSPLTIENLIREGVTPQVGIAVCGKAIIATVDPGYFPELMALWQMWRAFPVEEATFYNYLSAPVLSIDNEEIVWSLYKTEEGEILLLIANAGGPRLNDSPSIGANITLDLEALGLPDTLRCWRMRGNTYDTFRITEMEAVRAGCLSIYEIDLHEFQGYILAPKNPPETLVKLQKHLAGRGERLKAQLPAKIKRLEKLDHQLDSFAKLPNAHTFFSYTEFMAGRVAE